MAYYTKIGFFLLFSSTLLVVWPLFLNFNLKPVAVTRLRRHDGGGGEEEYGDNDNVEEVVENDTDGTNSPDKKKSFLRPEIAWLMSFPCSVRTNALWQYDVLFTFNFCWVLECPLSPFHNLTLLNLNKTDSFIIYFFVRVHLTRLTIPNASATLQWLQTI